MSSIMLTVQGAMNNFPTRGVKGPPGFGIKRTVPEAKSCVTKKIAATPLLLSHDKPRVRVANATEMIKFSQKANVPNWDKVNIERNQVKPA
mmetsp:Transcript_8323/g.12818  ORF Transcript_8323/g.12818 Transcript_8323/m.12818 type:complete len:91 (-) Transcript_8323:674-946(-)